MNAKALAKQFGVFLAMYAAARVIEEVIENLTGGEDLFNMVADKVVPGSAGGAA